MKSHFGRFYLKILEISGFYVYGDIILHLIREFQRYFPRNLRHSVGMSKITKRNQDVRFSFAISGHA